MELLINILDFNMKMIQVVECYNLILNNIVLYKIRGIM